MHITKLELQNFRGFEHEIIDLDDITVFVGENNTGKTSIMDAIKLIIGTPSWQEGLSRYDYHLGSSKANPGDAGEIIIKAEMSEKKKMNGLMKFNKLYQRLLIMMKKVCDTFI